MLRNPLAGTPAAAAAATDGGALPSVPSMASVPSMRQHKISNGAAEGWRGVLIAVTKMTLMTVAWLCFFIFFIWAASINTWNREDKERYWTRLRALLIERYNVLGRQQTLLNGSESVYLLFFFCTTLLAMICTTVAYLLPRSRAWDSLMGFLGHVFGPAKRLYDWPMPLRRFWLSWSGGLTLGEATLWAGWAVVHAVGFWKFYARRAKGNTKYQAWDDAGLRMYVPYSVLTLEDIGLAFGFLSIIDIAILFFPISHNTFLNRMLGIPYTGLIRFHRWIGHFALWMVAMHGFFYYALWIADPTVNFWSAFFEWSVTNSIPHLAGNLSFAGGLLIWITSVEYVRRNYFNLFYRCHLIGFVLFIVFAIVHYYPLWYAFFPGLFLYAADVVVRSYYTHKGAHISCLRRSDSGGVTHVDICLPPKTFQNPMSMRGAHIFMRVPALSRLEWHPFTVADVSVDAEGFTTLCVVVKSFAEWTKRLSKLAAETEASGKAALNVNIWRPFDLMHIDYKQYNDLLIIAGGIAVTPAAALLRNIIADVESAAADVVPRRVRLMFMARHRDELEALGKDILEATRLHDWLEVSLYQTGAKPAAAIAPKDVSGAKDGKDLATNSDSISSSSGSDNLAKDGIDTAPSMAKNIMRTSSSDEGYSSSDLAISSKPLTRGDKFWNVIRRTLPVDFMSDAQMIWVVLLAFLGGFMGLVLSKAFIIEFYNLDNNYIKVRGLLGFVLTVIMAIDSVGLPALFVLGPVYYKKLVDKLRKRDPAMPPSLGIQASPAASIDATGCYLCSPESGVSLPITAGRPDLQAAVAEFASDAHAAGSTAAVVSAGPRAIMESVAMAINNVNGLNCCGSGAYVHKVEVAFEF